MRGKVYNTSKNVYEAAKERIAWIFDHYEKIIVSCSGGKDSTVLLYLALEEAQKRDRKIYCFFLDQEYEYNHTINLITELMKHPNIIPLWFQIHGILPTPIHHEDYWLEPWNPAEEENWLRAKKRVSIKEITWEHNVKYSFPEQKKFGFYGLIKCMEQMFGNEPVAQLVGLRAEESLDRFRAVVNNAGIEGINWCTKGRYNNMKFYPMYDWTFQDLFVYLAKNKLKYNKLYDLFWKKGYAIKDMRISSLMNRKAFDCLVDIQEFEPDLYDNLLQRAQGVKTASKYAKEGRILSVKKLPQNFKSWKEYRDFLLKTMQNKEHAKVFQERFEKQLDNDYVYKQQCFQLQIHDITNSKKINNIEDPNKTKRFAWMEQL